MTIIFLNTSSISSRRDTLKRNNSYMQQYFFDAVRESLGSEEDCVGVVWSPKLQALVLSATSNGIAPASSPRPWVFRSRLNSAAQHMKVHDKADTRRTIPQKPLKAKGQERENVGKRK
eukprot:5695506-Amphidinium_carterae.3